MDEKTISYAKSIAKGQFEKLCDTGAAEDMISFISEDGIEIVDPWTDPTGRFSLTDDEAIKTYGKDKIVKFVQACNA